MKGASLSGQDIFETWMSAFDQFCSEENRTTPHLYFDSGFCAIFTIGTFLKNFRNFAISRNPVHDNSQWVNCDSKAFAAPNKYRHRVVSKYVSQTQHNVITRRASVPAVVFLGHDTIDRGQGGSDPGILFFSTRIRIKRIL